MVGGVTDRFVTVNERVFISMDGTLHFSYNRPEDATSYACTLASASSRSGQYGPFFRLLLPQGGELGAFGPRIDEFQPQVFPELPIRGQTVWIECFAYGFPAPTYHWSRVDGAPLSSRHKLTNFGRVLRIDEVQSDDATRFRCTATNDLGSATAELHLVVQTPPIIARPLVDLLVATNSTVRLACPIVEAHLTTVVHVEWFRNGQPLVPVLMPSGERRRFRLNQNELAISGIRVEDSQVYQCRLTNEVGIVSSSALIAVHDSRPQFHPNVFPRRVFVVEGTALRLPCLFYSMPRGSSRWQRLSRDSAVVASFDQTDESGIVLLLIDSFGLPHQGDYECRAQNEFGEARAVVQLVMMARPKVSISQAVKPEADGYGLRITCEAELECATKSACPEAHFNWEFNDRKAEQLPELRVRQVARSVDGDKKIRQKTSIDATSEFVSRNVGRFACSSIFGGASAELEPAGGLQTPVAAPTQLRILDIESTTVKLSWRLPLTQKSRDSRLSGFQIEKRASTDRTWRPHGSSEFQTSDRIVTAFRVRDLQPNSKYQFRVRARSIDGALSLPSTPTDWVGTPPAAPDDVIQNLRWKLLDSTHLLLEWDPIEKSYQSGPNLRYNVTWSGVDEIAPHFGIVEQPNLIIALKPNDLQHDPRTACPTIAVGVQPLNDLGQGPAVTETVAYIADQKPKRRAVDLQLTTHNATHLKFTWRWVEVEQCENVRGVLVSCIDEWEDAETSKSTVLTPETSAVNVSIPSYSTHFLVGGLEPWTSYRCSLVAFDQHGRRGPVSVTSRAAQTAEPPPRDSPTIVRVKLHETLSGFTTLIDWTAVRLDTAFNSTREQRGYLVYVFISETAELPITLELRESEMADVRRPSARIDGLKLMFLYRIQVAGFNRGGIGPPSIATSIRIGAPEQQHAIPDSGYQVRWSKLLNIGLFLLLRSWTR